MVANASTFQFQIFPQLNQASTLLQFNEAVSKLESFFSVHPSLLDLNTLGTITKVFSNALAKLKDLRPLHEIEEYPYNRFNSTVLSCIEIYGQRVLNTCAAICSFLEACDKVPRPTSPL